MKYLKPIILFLLIALPASDMLSAEDGIVVKKNMADEPLAKTFSSQNSIAFIERSVSRWQTKYKCITCHTNGLHLVAGSVVTPQSEVLLKNREFSRNYLSGYVQNKIKPKGSRGAIEGIVAGTSFLVISEMNTAKALHPDTEAALDYLWTRQSQSGAWDNWIKCHWGPFEVDDHYGVSLAAIALAMTPEAYRNKPESIHAWQNLKKYMKANPPVSAHQKGMLLWLSHYTPDALTSANKKKWLKELRDLQQDDGGWVLIHLGNADWKRKDKQPQAQISDGYATAFVIYALRQSGALASDPAIQRGIAWLKTHQRESGRWFTHSPHVDGRHYITQAASNMALLALSSCEALSD
ncbi:MAG: squalene--hopene cyclase [Blastopirellula sp.]|nr:MAG: squalene--hopene cyclase [Blastopirellula sp.]